ncbi:MAG: STAS domain-containing protein, partial [Sporichthyaceae bacterium]|nr:STAS domain-containing protein [Sporichthyaceae bacterium]
YAIWGTSRYLNVGTESSVAILVAASLAPLAEHEPARYVNLAALLALLTGTVLLVGWVLRLGVVTRLLSLPVLTGYLAGSAVVIALNQLPKMFGIPVDTARHPYVVGGIVEGIGGTNGWALALTAGTIAAMLGLGRISRGIPAGFVAIALATAAVAAAGLNGEVDTVGEIPAGLPHPGLPGFRLADVLDLLLPAASIALLVFSGGVLTAQALAAEDGEDLDANRQFVGLGAGNLAAGLIGGFPAAGSQSRSFAAASSGAGSQRAGLVCAGLLVLTLVVLTPLFRDVPDAALGAVVLLTAARLVDLATMRKLWRIRRADFLLMVITFTGVLVFGVLGGIVVGVMTSLAEIVRRTIQPRTAVLGLVGGRETWRDTTVHDTETLPGLIVYRFDAPVFFGNADLLRDEVRQLVASARPVVTHVLINAEAITDLDTTGAGVLSRLLTDLRAQQVRLWLARVRYPVLDMMRQTGFLGDLGEQAVFDEIAPAVEAFRRDAGGAPH